MREITASQIHETVDAIYRGESRRVFATLVRLLGDFELAEEALHDAFASATRSPRDWTQHRQASACWIRETRFGVVTALPTCYVR